MLRLIYQPYKWLVFLPLFGLSTLFWGTLCLLICLIDGNLASRVAARAWGRTNMFITPASCKVQGELFLDPSQSYVVVANHSSQFDIFALYGWLKLDLKWVIKKELRKVPIIGAACAAMGHIFIDRKDRQAASAELKKARSSLKPGTSIMIFPEGTRSDDGSLQTFKAGGFVMAKDLGIPILPITVIGAHKILPNNSIDLFPGEMQLVIHEPIPADQVASMSVHELIECSRSAIASAMDGEVVPLAAEA